MKVPGKPNRSLSPCATCLQMPGRRGFGSGPRPPASPRWAPGSAPPGAMATRRPRGREGSSRRPRVCAAGGRRSPWDRALTSRTCARSRSSREPEAVSRQGPVHSVYVPYQRLNLNAYTFPSPGGDRAGARRWLRTLRAVPGPHGFPAAGGRQPLARGCIRPCLEREAALGSERLPLAFGDRGQSCGSAPDRTPESAPAQGVIQPKC